MRSTRLALLPVLCLFMCLLLACGTYVTATNLNRSPRPLQPRPASEVELFASAPPARPYVDVALLEAEQTRSLNAQGTEIIIQQLRERAGAMGCDAILLGSSSEKAGELNGSGLELLAPPSTIRQATCLVYTKPAASAGGNTAAR